MVKGNARLGEIVNYNLGDTRRRYGIGLLQASAVRPTIRKNKMYFAVESVKPKKKFRFIGEAPLNLKRASNR